MYVCQILSMLKSFYCGHRTLAGISLHRGHIKMLPLWLLIPYHWLKIFNKFPYMSAPFNILYEPFRSSSFWLSKQVDKTFILNDAIISCHEPLNKWVDMWKNSIGTCLLIRETTNLIVVSALKSARAIL